MPTKQGNLRNKTLGGAKLSTAFDDLDKPNTFLYLIVFSRKIQLRFYSSSLENRGNFLLGEMFVLDVQRVF